MTSCTCLLLYGTEIMIYAETVPICFLFKGAVPCLPRELTTMREVVYKQCSHMRRGRNTCFNHCPCSSCGRPTFQLGFFLPSYFGWRWTNLWITLRANQQFVFISQNSNVSLSMSKRKLKRTSMYMEAFAWASGLKVWDKKIWSYLPFASSHFQWN